MRTRQTAGEKKDFFLKLTILQLVFCALLFAFCFCAMKWSPDLFETLRSGFSALMEKDLDPGAVTFFPPQTSENADQTSAAPAAEETQTEASAEKSAQTAAAGGEDLPDGGAAGLVGFGFYETAETPVLPVQGTVTSGFGERTHPIYGTRGFHSGRDIAAPEGTPICAALDGTVVAAGCGEKSGNYVRLSHGDGLETLYCHCSRLNVSEGVSVRKGDVIAFVGQTGLATGPHLHFEVRVGGEVRDPAYLLDNACSVS